MGWGLCVRVHGLVQSEAAAGPDDFSDFSFVDFSRLKSSVVGFLHGGAKGGEEEDEAAGAGRAPDASERVSHRDAVTPELVEHLRKLDTGSATGAGVSGGS